MQLADYQNQFIDMLFNNKFDATLFNGDTATNLTRLQIYRDSCHGHRVAAYRNLFTCCIKIVGEDFWQSLIDDFINATPSCSLDITISAQQLPTFIENHTAASSIAYLADLATLELAWHQCFHQATKTMTAQLASLPDAIQQQGQQLVLQLASGSQLISSRFALDEIWQFCQIQPEQQQLNLTEGQFYFILHRKRDSIIITQIDSDAWAICQQLYQKNCSIITLCANLQTQFVNHALMQLVEQQIVTWSN